MLNLTARFTNRTAANAKDCLRLNAFRCQYFTYGQQIFAVKEVLETGWLRAQQVIVCASGYVFLDSQTRSFRQFEVRCYTNELAMQFLDKALFGEQE